MPVTSTRYKIGIDLGTSNSALCYLDEESLQSELHAFEIPQWLSAGEWHAQVTLPSHIYLLTEDEIGSGRFCLPDAAESRPTWIIGEWARQQQALRPGRNIHSAKSWLCYHNLNPRAAILPQTAPADLPRHSPLAVSAMILGHLRDAWNVAFASQNPALRMEHQELVLTVPASFDEAAREYTLQAVEMAGLSNVTLLEEPQAAFYAWLSQMLGTDQMGSLSQHFSMGENLVLVVDVGGGTSDFSLVRVTLPDSVKEGPKLERVAVSDHILLGGDNMDLALAAHVEQKLTGQKRQLSPRLWEALVGQCRRAKEALLNSEYTTYPLTIAEQGSRLIGRTQTYELSRAELESVLLEDFFPELTWEAPLPATKRQGLRTMGLPYANDPAITRHLLRFLRNHCAGPATENFPSHVLFNGGTLAPELLQERFRKQLNDWRQERHPPRNNWEVRVLPQASMHLAVARGAAYYHLVRQGQGLRILGGSARAYYVSLMLEGASANLSERVWLCVLPQHASTEQIHELRQPLLELAVNQPVQFEMRASSVRVQDSVGEILRLADEELEQDFTLLPPIQTFIAVDRNRLPKKAQTLRIQLRARLNEIGTLSLYCVSPELKEEWRLEFRVHESAESPDSGLPLSEAPSEGLFPPEWEEVQQVLRQWFGKKSRQDDLPVSLFKQLEILLGPRQRWSLPILRAVADELLAKMGTRVRSLNHELNWLKVAGFCLRPGFGFAQDEWRMRQLGDWIAHGPQNRKERTAEVEWWIFCRRIAAGLEASTQEALLLSLEARLREVSKKPRTSKPGKGKKVNSASPAALNELWLLLASLEEIPAERKRIHGDQLLERLQQGNATGIEGWCLARLGSRQPLRGNSLQVISTAEVTGWICTLLGIGKKNSLPELPLVLAQLAQHTGDRRRDVSPELRQEVLEFVIPHDESGRLQRLLREGAEPLGSHPESNLQNWLFGDELPLGLKLSQSS